MYVSRRSTKDTFYIPQGELGKCKQDFFFVKTRLIVPLEMNPNISNKPKGGAMKQTEAHAGAGFRDFCKHVNFT